MRLLPCANNGLGLRLNMIELVFNGSCRFGSAGREWQVVPGFNAIGEKGFFKALSTGRK